jgi:outer membrane protein OmpA-like peptidoglycan-associated protein
VSTSFAPEALAELPAVLQAKPVMRMETTVPTALILWMVQGARNNRGPEPGWADRLLVDLKDLPKAGPSSTVHIAVFQTVPFRIKETDKLQAFQRYCMKQHPSKLPPIDVLSVGDYMAHRQLEELLRLPAGSISTNAGLPSQMAADQAATYKLIVYAVLPRTVGRVIAPRDQRSLRGFDFGKWLLTEEHERMLDSLGREAVRSWDSRRSVTRIVAEGHTDPVGTHDFNIKLGRHRAEAVAKRLKEIINDYAAAARFPAGVLDKIEYVVASYGEERPFSRTLQTLNRRVELTLYRDYRPPPQPLDEDNTFKRQTDLLQRNPTRDPDTTQRLRCLLVKMRQAGVDDRYVNETQVFLITRDNKLPGADGVEPSPFDASRSGPVRSPDSRRSGDQEPRVAGRGDRRWRRQDDPDHGLRPRSRVGTGSAGAGQCVQAVQRVGDDAAEGPSEHLQLLRRSLPLEEQHGARQRHLGPSRAPGLASPSRSPSHREAAPVRLSASGIWSRPRCQHSAAPTASASAANPASPPATPRLQPESIHARGWRSMTGQQRAPLVDITQRLTGRACPTAV